MKKVKVFLMLLVITPVAALLAACGSPAVEKIFVASNNHRTNYSYGEALDVSGLEIGVKKSDGSTSMITVQASWVTGFESDKLGKQTLKITYQGKEVTYEVYVRELADVFKLREFALKSLVYEVDGAKVYGKYNFEDTVKILKDTLAENASLVSITSELWLQVYDEFFKGEILQNSVACNKACTKIKHDVDCSFNDGKACDEECDAKDHANDCAFKPELRKEGYVDQLIQAFYTKSGVNARSTSSTSKWQWVQYKKTLTSFESLIKESMTQHMRDYGVGYMVSQAAFNTGVNNLAQYVLAFNTSNYLPFSEYFAANPTVKTELVEFFKEQLGKTYNGKSLRKAIEDAYDTVLTKIIKFTLCDFEFMEIRKTGATFDKMSFYTFYETLFQNEEFHLNEVTGEITFMGKAALNDSFNMVESEGKIEITVPVETSWVEELRFTEDRFKDKDDYGNVVPGEYEKYKDIVINISYIFESMLQSVTLGLQ